MHLKKISFIIYILLITLSSHAQQKPLELGLQMFKNIEQIEYCVPLPLSTFKEIYDTEKAQHLFVHKKDKKITIQLKGFYSDDKNITLENYYTKSYTEDEEMSGKLITQKEIIKNKKCFYAIGYYNNFIGKYEFVEVTWVRNDEVTRLEVMYAIKDKKLWYERLKVIIKNAYCK